MVKSAAQIFTPLSGTQVISRFEWRSCNPPLVFVQCYTIL